MHTLPLSSFSTRLDHDERFGTITRLEFLSDSPLVNERSYYVGVLYQALGQLYKIHGDHPMFPLHIVVNSHGTTGTPMAKA